MDLQEIQTNFEEYRRKSFEPQSELLERRDSTNNYSPKIMEKKIREKRASTKNNIEINISDTEEYYVVFIA